MNVHPLFTAVQIQDAVQTTANKILAYFGSEEPVIALCLLNGAIWYTADLLRLLPPNFELQTIRISSYAGSESTGNLNWHSAPPDCAGKRVLVIDDVLDTGLTLQSLCAELYKNGASDVITTVAVNKIGCRKATFEADFYALECENLFLVGYGLDFNGKYRNLPYIGYIEK